MARYSPEHKQATRRRMIATAGRRFKSDGIDGSGIATLVADAGLTNGAFYGHFTSKDDLVAAVVAHELAHQVDIVDSLPPGLDSVAEFLRDYLSPAHRDDVAGGCPSAALLDEIARSNVAIRETYTEGATAMMRAITRHLGSDDAAEPDPRAIAVFTLVVGSLQAARAVTDPDLSDRIRATAYDTAITILTTAPDQSGPTNEEAT
jgi:TetR/AcrR family transcriptional regulator, transcriptional repressor for nem operon